MWVSLFWMGRGLERGAYMSRYFNTEGSCNPLDHYMVNLDGRLDQIKTECAEPGKYFTINRARQYGKTTTLGALAGYLRKWYEVVELDFQMLSQADFKSESTFVAAFAREVLFVVQDNITVSDDLKQQLGHFTFEKDSNRFATIFRVLSEWCAQSDKPIVLMIDEVDSATNNQVFLDFLAQLRGYYLQRKKRAAFHSVILAGVYDVKNLKRKLRPEEEHKINSPWNIAAEFNVVMSFSAEEIAGMLTEYEKDHYTGMDVSVIGQLIYDYTAGYPFLVSRICKIIDERLVGCPQFTSCESAWTYAGVVEAVKYLLVEKNTLFESLMRKIDDYPELRELLYSLLFVGKNISYNPDEPAFDIAVMFGFIKNDNGVIAVANRVFETRIYNRFLTASEVQSTDIYRAALQDKNQFVQNGHLNMDLVLERFVAHFEEIYGDQPDKFIEDAGRRIFLMYLRPIINGEGNYYIEAQTRNMERTDVIVDYHGEQFIVEMKVWRGNSYHERGEQQLADYLEYYHLKKGYLLSFNFNKKKQTGIKRIHLGDKVLIEAVV